MGFTELIIGSVGFCLSIVLFLLSCILDGTWYNMLALIPAFLLAVPFLFCFSDSSNYAENDGWLNSGQFFSGFLISSVIAVPMLNYHLGAIVARQFWLAIGADLVMIGAFAGFFGYQHFNKDDSDWA